ncbi:DUF6088 family protein [Geopseudomonas aromaticivorans]
MPIASTIWQQVKYLPKGRPFSSRRFVGLGSRSAVGKALARLVSAGELERITRGIYMRPKISPYVGSVRPSALAVIRVIAKQNHETIQVHGAEAVRAFHLSTQMQTKPVLYTSGSSREIQIGALTIRLRHVSPEKLQHAGTKVGLALVALFYLGSNGVIPTSVTKIKSQLTPAELKQLAACKMPAWMSKALAGPPPG